MELPVPLLPKKPLLPPLELFERLGEGVLAPLVGLLPFSVPCSLSASPRMVRMSPAVTKRRG